MRTKKQLADRAWWRVHKGKRWLAALIWLDRHGEWGEGQSTIRTHPVPLRSLYKRVPPSFYKPTE